MPNYKLTYFDFGGAAEKVRLAFKVAGIPFEDKRISFAEWPALKASTPLGQVPILEFDGQTITQSDAMLRYIGAQANLNGTTPAEILKVEEILGLANDLVRDIVPSMLILRDPAVLGHDDRTAEKNAAIQTKLRADLVADGSHFLKTWALIDQRIKENGNNGYTVGNSITIADLAVYPLANWVATGDLDGIPASTVETLEALTKLRTTVAARVAQPTYKLTYFDAPGVAEKVRLAFKVAGIPFEDKRFTHAEWPEVKKTTPSDQVPILEFNGQTVTQSDAILRYVGALGGLNGATPAEVLAVDEVVGIVGDIFRDIGPSLKIAFGLPGYAHDDKTAEERTAIVLKLRADLLVDGSKFLKNWALMEKRIQDNGNTGFVVGNSVTIADLALYPLVNWIHSGMMLDGLSSDFLGKLTGIDKLRATVAALPAIAA